MTTPQGMSNFSSRMSNFFERYSSQATDSRNLSVRAVGTSGQVEFLKVQNDGEAVRVAYTGLVLSNDPDTSEIQSCAFYLSALSAVFPGLEEVSKQALRLIGYSTQDVTVTTADQYFITILDWIEIPKLAVMIGQAVLLLFKNITEAGYRQFMISRITAMKAKAGYPARSAVTNDGDIVFSLDRAMMIRTRLGAFQILRSQVLLAQLANQEVPGPIGGVCNYLCGILAWTEMAYMVFIFDVLCVTKSPVLRDPRIQNEIRALCVAYNEINKTEQPQYYKILFPDKASNVLIKSRFPVLIAVATKCRSSQYGTVLRYVSPITENNILVAELIGVHQRYIMEASLVEQNRMVAYLTGVDPDETEPSASATNTQPQNQ